MNARRAWGLCFYFLSFIVLIVHGGHRLETTSPLAHTHSCIVCSCLVGRHDELGCMLSPGCSDHLLTAASLPDLVLEIFNKCLKGQSVLPLETRCHFVLLYNEDAADLGQKQLLKLRPGLCMGRYLRPHTDSASYFGHSPTKEMDASSKKLRCSKRKVALLPKRTCQQTIS